MKIPVKFSENDCLIKTEFETGAGKYDEGYNKGYKEGETETYPKAYEDGKNDGITEGYENGKTDGITEGYNTGYNTGHSEGYEKGSAEGYPNGYADGKADGYNEGKADGITEGSTLIKQRITGTLTSYSDEEITTIAGSAFAGCSKLTSINIPNAITIGISAFENTGLLKADFPLLTTLPQNSFRGCSNLTLINFPKVTLINTSAFYDCQKLPYADFLNVDKIVSLAFKSCKALKTLCIRDTIGVCTLLNVSAFDDTPIKSGTGYIYVPKALVDRYKTATNWTTFASQIRAIEDYPEITGG